MSRQRPSAPPPDEPKRPQPGPEQSPLSLSRLRAAFAQMLGSSELGGSQQGAGSKEQGTKPSNNKKTVASPQSVVTAPDPCEIGPRTVVEAMLFVGRPDNSPFSARELAAAMRGVSPAEIDAAVAELNAAYQRDDAPYEIASFPQGHKLQLRDQLSRMRDKLSVRVREAKLTPAAVEVLSVVAYNQPTTVEAINELRGAPSGPVLQSLVRRKLVRIDRPADRNAPPQFSTTDRFLRVFGLESAAAMPRSEELEKL
jgi:segregation and condensation protein B